MIIDVPLGSYKIKTLEINTNITVSEIKVKIPFMLPGICCTSFKTLLFNIPIFAFY